MKARFSIEDPNEIECSLTITMSVRQWENLRNQLSREHPSWKLSAAINQVVTEAVRVYKADEIEVEG